MSSVLFASLVSAVAAGAPVETGRVHRIVVLDLTSPKGLEELAVDLSEVVVGAIRTGAAGAEVVSQTEITAMIRLEADRQALGCSDDTACLAEVGGAMGADHLVVGRIGKVGSTYLLSLKLVDTRQATVLRHVSEQVPGSLDDLLEVVTDSAAKLVQGLAPAQPAASPTAAVGPTTPPTVDAEGEVTPWYGRWWVWTLAGAVVIGGVATAVALGADGSGSDADGPVNGSVGLDLGGI